MENRIIIAFCTQTRGKYRIWHLFGDDLGHGEMIYQAKFDSVEEAFRIAKRMYDNTLIQKPFPIRMFDRGWPDAVS